ncbi:hypothetical protein GLYMA_17G161750v4 [Glycine max]|nr:hypothetical protein GLYMA_17G161750v4 [Glycine max]KAH1118698.1 hypothetical protein GYH30_047463 [Glycine max]
MICRTNIVSAIGSEFPKQRVIIMRIQQWFSFDRINIFLVEDSGDKVQIPCMRRRINYVTILRCSIPNSGVVEIGVLSSTSNSPNVYSPPISNSPLHCLITTRET